MTIAKQTILCAALLLVGLVPSSPPAVAGDSQEAKTEATFICRSAQAGEIPTAQLRSSATMLVCRKLAIQMREADGTMKVIGNVTAHPQPGPDFSKVLTPQQMQAACETWLETVFHIDRSP